MNPKLDLIKKEIGDFYKKEFGKDLLFVIIYGSWAFGLNNKSSDVDMVGVCLRYNKKQMKNTISFVKNLHRKCKLEFDEEVPYEKKLLATPNFVEKAIFGNGFNKDRGRIKIQPIVKTKEFLSSDKTAMRLLLNALTTKSLFCGGNYKLYKETKDNALKNTVRIFYSAWNIDAATLDSFVRNLIKRDGKTGQFYLGFDDNPKVKRYLMNLFKRTFDSLFSEGHLSKRENKFFINNTKWFREINLI